MPITRKPTTPASATPPAAGPTSADSTPTNPTPVGSTPTDVTADESAPEVSSEAPPTAPLAAISDPPAEVRPGSDETTDAESDRASDNRATEARVVSSEVAADDRSDAASADPSVGVPDGRSAGARVVRSAGARVIRSAGARVVRSAGARVVRSEGVADVKKRLSEAQPDPSNELSDAEPTVPIAVRPAVTPAATPAGSTDRWSDRPSVSPEARPEVPIDDRAEVSLDSRPEISPDDRAEGSLDIEIRPADASARPGSPSSPSSTPKSTPKSTRTRAGSIGVAIVLVAAGLLFTTSATTARGTQFRSERADLADLIAAEDLRVKTRTQRLATLRKEVQQEVAAGTENSEAVEALEKRSASVISAAGLQSMTGPGLTVALDDAPRDGPVPDQAGPDDLVVHQQDVQAVVNALWAGGAEAMMLQDQRVISTSAVRCVGNTLILQGRVYSPPYRITVIGDVKKMRAALDSSPQIAYYLQYVASLRLGWEVKESNRLKLPAYSGSLTLSHARVAGSATPSSGSSGSASSSP